MRQAEGKKGVRVIKVCCSLSFLRLLGCFFIRCFANRNEPGLSARGEGTSVKARPRVLSWLRAPREVGVSREQSWLSLHGGQPARTLPGWSTRRSRARDCGVEILVCAVSAERASQVHFAGLYQTGYGWVPGTPGSCRASTPHPRRDAQDPPHFTPLSEEPEPRSRVLILRAPAAPEHIWAFLPQQMSRMCS